MERSSVRPTDGAETIVLIYGNMLFRLCLVMLGNDSDAEDAVQETIIKYLQKAPSFENSEHEKAWLVTVAKNQYVGSAKADQPLEMNGIWECEFEI